jgi:ATP-dependent helicase/nuclease subunit A
MAILADMAARERAVTATDRNQVVTAGAGTGKTTLLVDRLVHLLARRPDPLTIGEIVALTFTNKAANEMKIRLRERLGRLVAMDPAGPQAPTASETRRREWEQMTDLLTRYGLSKARFNELATAALRELEKGQIGTIHSFAAHLLRLYPVEAGVDPAFQEDDGALLKEHLNREWELWLDEELGLAGAHHETWRSVLRVMTLDEVKDLAGRLVSELIPLQDHLAQIEAQGSGGAVPAPIRTWFRALAARATALRQARSKVLTLERMLEAAASRLEQVAELGPARGVAEPADLDRAIPTQTQAWPKEEYDEAKRIIKVAQAVGQVQTGPLVPLLRLLIPFAERCRRSFAERGMVSFDGLLARARMLLREFPSIRRELKARFKAILVDEFQDTDPVQYEMILYLAEAGGREARRWDEVRLEPGKLFIVGDPKQSIYAFRRADMEAYDAVIEDQVLAQVPPGEQHSLQTNFRSHTGLLAPINACFSRLFPPTLQKGLQPKHEPLLAPPEQQASLSGEWIEIRLVRPEDEEADADTTTRCEAESLARWLRGELFGREEIRDRDGSVPIKPGHVAILLRTLTSARDYLDALRRHDVPYLTEGEKDFYERQEVIDLVNLLRAAVDPHDQVALAGVLRSPLGGLTDQEIEALVRSKGLDYRNARAEQAGRAAGLYTLLRDLHRELPLCPLAEVMDAVFARTPALELAAASLDGEQAVANLLKLRDTCMALSAGPEMTLRGLVASLTVTLREPPDESESSLAEEGEEAERGGGAVRVLSIHKAKGLEFPVVILAGLQRGTDRRSSSVLVQHDWSSGIVGVRVGDFQTLGGLYMGAKLEERQRAEQIRLLYVAMTRAKRKVVLSAGLPKSKGRAADSLLALLSRALGQDLFEAQSGEIAIGESQVLVEVLIGREAPLRAGGVEDRWQDADDDPGGLQARWAERARRYEEARATSRFLTPTALKASVKTGGEGVRSPFPIGERGEGGGEAPSGQGSARLIGTLAHQALEDWNFSAEPERLHAQIDALCQGLSAEIGEDLHEMFNRFVASAPFEDLRRAEILGREVPFCMPWVQKSSHASLLTPGDSACIMEGVIDLVYRLDGQIWIADYKTDRVREEEVAGRAAEYQQQARVYAEAVADSLGIDTVRAQLLFLRSGLAVEV